jgi:hypothetical protein
MVEAAAATTSLKGVVGGLHVRLATAAVGVACQVRCVAAVLHSHQLHLTSLARGAELGIAEMIHSQAAAHVSMEAAR